MYKVIHFFTDLQDSDHPYNVGDPFPRVGKEVSDERLAELSGPDNLQKVPLIELVPEPAEPAEDETPKSAPVRKKKGTKKE